MPTLKLFIEEYLRLSYQPWMTMDFSWLIYVTINATEHILDLIFYSNGDSGSESREVENLQSGIECSMA